MSYKNGNGKDCPFGKVLRMNIHNLRQKNGTFFTVKQKVNIRITIQ